MIEVAELTKRNGPTTAVDALTFTARPGQVTGFLGPNGAGKSTTMRLVLGLDHADAGTQTHGIGRRRVTAVVDQVGLVEVARRRVGTFSLGMRQRLGVIGRGRLLADTTPSDLRADHPSLEDAFLALTRAAIDYHGSDHAGSGR